MVNRLLHAAFILGVGCCGLVLATTSSGDDALVALAYESSDAPASAASSAECGASEVCTYAVAAPASSPESLPTPLPSSDAATLVSRTEDVDAMLAQRAALDQLRSYQRHFHVRSNVSSGSSKRIITLASSSDRCTVTVLRKTSGLWLVERSVCSMIGVGK